MRCRVLASAIVSAHHSSAGIDRTKSVELVGTIKQFSWTNPHSWMEVEVPDRKGRHVDWKVEMTSPAYLVRARVEVHDGEDWRRSEGDRAPAARRIAGRSVRVGAAGRRAHVHRAPDRHDSARIAESVGR